MGFADLETTKKLLGIPASVTKHDLAIECAIDAVNAELLEFFCLDACEPTTYQVRAELPCCDGPWWKVSVEPQPLISISTLTTQGREVDPDSIRIVDSWVSICACGCPQAFCCGCDGFVAEVVAGFEEVPANLVRAASLYAAQTFRGDNPDLKVEQIGRHRIERFGPGDLAAGAIVGWPNALTRATSRWVRLHSAVRAERFTK